MVISKEELLAKALKWGDIALKSHSFYKGKIEIVPKCQIKSLSDFAIWYTPGVATPCKEINKNKDTVFNYTNKWNYVAVVSDGSRVLGLGDIGPEASLPVMEGKALLFKYLGGVDAFPICVATKDSEEIIKVCKWIEPTFGGINLEDIASPKCFYILEKLRKEMTIPVWHDDQQGTAVVTLAGLINALKIVGKKIDEVEIAMIGAGAANINNYRCLKLAGVKPSHVTMTDINGIITSERANEEYFKQVEEAFGFNICLETNVEGKTGKTPEEAIKNAMKGTDVCIAFSRSGPDVIKKEWVANMADDAIIFACANPIPEIWPWEAEAAGARIVATGRSDFPNQVNNSLGFPGIFRGVLDVRARTITDEMCIVAAKALAEYAEEKGISEDCILPDMSEWEAYVREAVAVGLKAIEQNVARIKLNKEELVERSSEIIKRSMESVKILMEKGIIQPLPANV